MAYANKMASLVNFTPEQLDVLKNRPGTASGQFGSIPNIEAYFGSQPRPVIRPTPETIPTMQSGTFQAAQTMAPELPIGMIGNQFQGFGQIEAQKQQELLNRARDLGMLVPYGESRSQAGSPHFIRLPGQTGLASMYTSGGQFRRDLKNAPPPMTRQFDPSSFNPAALSGHGLQQLAFAKEMAAEAEKARIMGLIPGAAPAPDITQGSPGMRPREDRDGRRKRRLGPTPPIGPTPQIGPPLTLAPTPQIGPPLTLASTSPASSLQALQNAYAKIFEEAQRYG